MKRYIAYIVVASVLPILGCPRGENAGVEHGNVCIDLSPDARSVVFSSAAGDLYLFDIATETATRLTETERTESYPPFSPDGKTVVSAASDLFTNPAHWLAKERAEPSDARETSAASVPKSKSITRSQ